jgi:RNA polymerase sigma-70 factor (ECF subfamily)
VSQAELIAHARRGDGAAWETLMREHQQAVFRLAYLLLGDADEAEDVAQETFIRAYRALERFDASRPLRPWLLRIASNLARNQRRSLGRYFGALQRLVQLDPEFRANARGAPRADPAGRPGPTPEDAHSLWQAVRRLRPADQEVIYLRYFLDLSEAETATALEVAPGTVKSRTHRALRRLRAVVEREFPSLRESLEP